MQACRSSRWQQAVPSRRALRVEYGVCSSLLGQQKPVHGPWRGHLSPGPQSRAGSRAARTGHGRADRRQRAAASVRPQATEGWTEEGKSPVCQTPARQVCPHRLRDGMTLLDGADAAEKMGTKRDTQRRFSPCHGLCSPAPQIHGEPRDLETRLHLQVGSSER